jgi:hypothetical protein
MVIVIVHRPSVERTAGSDPPTPRIIAGYIDFVNIDINIVEGRLSASASAPHILVAQAGKPALPSVIGDE